MSNLSMFERIGISTLKEMQKPMDHERLRAQLTKACSGELRTLSPEQVRNPLYIPLSVLHGNEISGFVFCVW